MLHIKLKGMVNAATRKYILCPYTHTIDPWVGSKVQTFFSEIVMFHIKFIGIEHNASTIKAYILSLHTLLASGSTVLCCISNQWAYSVLTHTSTPGVGSKGQIIFLNVAMLYIKLKGAKYIPT